MRRLRKSPGWEKERAWDQTAPRKRSRGPEVRDPDLWGHKEGKIVNDQRVLSPLSSSLPGSFLGARPSPADALQPLGRVPQATFGHSALHCPARAFTDSYLECSKGVLPSPVLRLC